MQKKVNVLVRLHEAMQEKLKTASYSEQIQILTLVPDKWSQMYCWEYFNVFEYPVWTSHEIKKVGGTLAKTASKKGNIITTETLIWWQTFIKMTISVGRCLKSKVVKEHINKNFAACKSLYNLQELYTAFEEKRPNVNIGFSKFCVLRPNWCLLGDSKMAHSFFAFSLLIKMLCC